jgi:RimJ/RimL family protein N-acetyltransferase
LQEASEADLVVRKQEAEHERVDLVLLHLIDSPHRRVEIGWTWLAVAHQRTGANTECKRLLLEHAFEKLGMMRVQLKTDARNLASQRAIERIGGVKEGVLRAHMVMPDGFVRDSVMYSITAEEWPGVKKRLSELCARR